MNTRSIIITLTLLFLSLVVVPAVGATDDPRCDERPDHPACGTTTTTSPTTTTVPGEALCVSMISGSNGDRYWNEAVEQGLQAPVIGLGGGDTHRWGTPLARNHDRYWDIYEAHEPDDCGPVQTFWLALSRHNTVVGSDAEAEADVIVALFLAHSPGGTLWVTPTQPYDPDTCHAENVEGSAHLVAYALEAYPETVKPIPDIEGVTWPTTIEHTTDGCHPGGDTLTAGAAYIVGWAEYVLAGQA